MKIIKTARYKKFIKAQFEKIRTEEDLKMEQMASISHEVLSYLRQRMEENPHMSPEALFKDAKYNFIDDEDYDNAPDYANMTERIITESIEQVTTEMEAGRDDYDQATYEAEMGIQDFKKYPDAYSVEDTSPCKDPLDRPRNNGKSKNHQGYLNMESNNFYNDTI